MSAKLLQSCLTLCGPMDCSLPSSSVHGILRARILEWVACRPPGHLPKPGIKPMFLTSPAFAGRFFTTSATWEHPHVSDRTANSNDSKRRIKCETKLLTAQTHESSLSVRKFQPGHFYSWSLSCRSKRRRR